LVNWGPAGVTLGMGTRGGPWGANGRRKRTVKPCGPSGLLREPEWRGKRAVAG
jgi:hypothetical protein